MGDMLFDLKGKGNRKLGTSGNIDSNWINMPYWRFRASILVAFLGYAFMLVAAICVIVAILKGFLDVPKWFVLLNPFVFLLVGVGFRKIKPVWFYDRPGIVMPSLGMGMFGLIAIVNML